MNIPTLKQTAQERLSYAGYDPRRLALIHSGAAIGLSLLLSFVNMLLIRQMDTTSGLSGITTRAILSFAQTMLLIITTAAMPFWEYGFYKAALNLSRSQPATPATLLTGFRRFGIVLRLVLLQTGLMVGVVLICIQAAAFLFLMSPWSMVTMVTADQLIEQGAALMDENAMMQMLQTMYPMYIMLAVLLCVILLPILYRFRLAEWAVLDDATGALRAMSLSAYWMHGKRKWLFRLDLSFWWYYGLLALCSVIAYGDRLLPLFGVSINADLAFWIFYLLSCAIQLIVTWQFAPQVQTTYALAYDALRAEKPPIRQKPMDN